MTQFNGGSSSSFLAEAEGKRPIWDATSGLKENLALEIFWGVSLVIGIIIFVFVLLPLLGVVTLYRRIRDI